MRKIVETSLIECSIDAIKDEDLVLVKFGSKFTGMIIYSIRGLYSYCEPDDQHVFLRKTKKEVMEDLLAQGYELYTN